NNRSGARSPFAEATLSSAEPEVHRERFPSRRQGRESSRPWVAKADVSATSTMRLDPPSNGEVRSIGAHLPGAKDRSPEDFSPRPSQGTPLDPTQVKLGKPSFWSEGTLSQVSPSAQSSPVEQTRCETSRIRATSRLWIVP